MAVLLDPHQQEVTIRSYEATMVAMGRAIVRMQRARRPQAEIAERQARLETIRDEHAQLRATSRALAGRSDDSDDTLADLTGGVHAHGRPATPWHYGPPDRAGMTSVVLDEV